MERLYQRLGQLALGVWEVSSHFIWSFWASARRSLSLFAKKLHSESIECFLRSLASVDIFANMLQWTWVQLCCTVLWLSLSLLSESEICSSLKKGPQSSFSFAPIWFLFFNKNELGVRKDVGGDVRGNKEVWRTALHFFSACISAWKIDSVNGNSELKKWVIEAAIDALRHLPCLLAAAWPRQPCLDVWNEFVEERGHHFHHGPFWWGRRGHVVRLKGWKLMRLWGGCYVLSRWWGRTVAKKKRQLIYEGYICILEKWRNCIS